MIPPRAQRPVLVVAAFMLLLAATAVPAGADTITIVQPNGGEKLTRGADYGIVWNYSGFPDTAKVTLTLLRNGRPVGDFAKDVAIRYAQSPSGTGAYKWKVGAFAAHGVDLGCGYKVRVKVQRTQRLTLPNRPAPPVTDADDSDGTFCIVAPGPAPTLKLESPNGGQLWALGSTRKIAWSSSGLIGQVRISLLQEGYNLGRGIIVRVPASQTSYDWKVGTLAPPYGSVNEPGKGFRIQIEGLSAGLTVQSKDTFAIVYGLAQPGTHSEPVQVSQAAIKAAPEMSVTSPAANEHWNRKETHTIEWNRGAGWNVPVAISLEHKGGYNTGAPIHQMIAASTANDGSFTWTIPPDTTPTDYVVRIATTDGKHTAESGTFFIQMKTVTKTKTVQPALARSCAENRWLDAGYCDGFSQPASQNFCPGYASGSELQVGRYGQGQWLSNSCMAHHAAVWDGQIFFNLSGFKPFFLVKAKFQFYGYYTADWGVSNLSLYNLDTPWVPGTVTGSKITDFPPFHPEGTGYSGKGEIDLTGYVRGWITNQPNFGLLVPNPYRDLTNSITVLYKLRMMNLTIEYLEEE